MLNGVKEYRDPLLNAQFKIHCIKVHLDLQNLRRWILMTSNAHALYQQFDFTSLSNADLYMELHIPDVYSRWHEIGERW